MSSLPLQKNINLGVVSTERRIITVTNITTPIILNAFISDETFISIASFNSNANQIILPSINYPNYKNKIIKIFNNAQLSNSAFRLFAQSPQTINGSTNGITFGLGSAREIQVYDENVWIVTNFM